jgi:hypothetical protein
MVRFFNFEKNMMHKNLSSLANSCFKKAKKFVLLSAVFCTVAGTAAASEWSKKDIALEATYLAFHIADWGQTRDIVRQYEQGRDRYETNPLLGKHPSKQAVDNHFIAGAILHLIIANMLEGNNRTWFQGVTITMEGLYVSNNARMGMKIDF